MTKGTHLLRSALLALLALAVISGGSLAAGDLFDDDYLDCPTKTRLRDGQISDLMVARDSDEEDEVNVSWAATDASSWGLGANAFDTSLVVILNDGANHTETMKLGQRKVTFDGIDTGKVVKVQMAIVVDHADGDYLISDILEMSINQSLTKPAFGGMWHRLKTTTDKDATATGFQYDSEEIKAGMMYYIGYNENFANYKKGTAAYTHKPSTQRLRIGLAHSANEDSDARDKVDFEAYIIRIADSGGDVVDEADDVATVATSYGTGGTGATVALNKLFVDDLQANERPTFGDKGTIVTAGSDNTIGTADDVDTGVILNNVRIVDGSKITVGMHLIADSVLNRNDTVTVQPASATIIKVGVAGDTDRTIGDIFANPPDEHRDFPIDTLTSDEPYTITAWAINEDDEVISPVATLTLRPVDTTLTLGDQATDPKLQDYLNTTAVESGTLIVTQFTVLK